MFPKQRMYLNQCS